jgi:hypothetical protein
MQLNTIQQQTYGSMSETGYLNHLNMYGFILIVGFVANTYTVYIQFMQLNTVQQQTYGLMSETGYLNNLTM